MKKQNKRVTKLLRELFARKYVDLGKIYELKKRGIVVY